MRSILLLILPYSTAAFSTRSLIFRTKTSSVWNKRFEAPSSQKRYRRCNFQRWPSACVSGSANGSEGEGMDISKTKILGICGGIGSGKSTACQLMVDSLGCVARIDADKLAHVVYEPGSKSLEEIVTEFGKDILDDSDKTQIDRKKLGAIVFSDAKSMSKLEHIVWPHVRDKIEERIEEIKLEHQSCTTSKENNLIIVEAALLLETNWHDLLDGLWVIQSSQSVATQRLKDNRGLSEEEALVRIHAQEKRRGIGGSADGSETSGKFCEDMENGIVTAVITNDGSLMDLQNALEKSFLDPESFKK